MVDKTNMKELEKERIFKNKIQYKLLKKNSHKIYTMNNGKVKFYNGFKGFGFIKDTKTEEEYFVHSSEVKDEIRQNDEVIFELKKGRKGLNAVNVKLI